MKRAIVVLSLSLMWIGPTHAATRLRCHAEVLRSEELPYAPVGFWLLKVTMRITNPRGPTAVSTFVKSSPWHLTVRRGDAFWFDCDRAGDPWLSSLEPVR
jgi:hypothetical protein